MKLELEISPRWRLVDDGVQWIIQMKKGKPTAKSTGWRAVKFLVTKSGLVRALQDTNVVPFPPALTKWLEVAPEQYPRGPKKGLKRTTGPSNSEAVPKSLNAKQALAHRSAGLSEGVRCHSGQENR